MPSLEPRGLFVTFEGGEGAGKTTLIEKLSQEFHRRGLPVQLTREPGGTPLGEKIRDWLLQKELSSEAELLLFLAARAEHVCRVIQPALQAGQMVLCDRFHDSSIAYQGFARNLGVDQVRLLTLFASRNLMPDLTFYLDLPPEQGLARVTRSRSCDRMEQESLGFHEKVRQAFLQIAREEPQRMHVIDASQSPDEVFQQVLKRLDA